MVSLFAIILFLLHNGVSNAGGYVRAWLDTIQYTKLPYQPPWAYNNTGTCETYLESIRKWRSAIYMRMNSVYLSKTSFGI